VDATGFHVKRPLLVKVAATWPELSETMPVVNPVDAL